jgi:diguanylate cyclase (GGDEF)-like protein/PAS domain S-box-containing protein
MIDRFKRKVGELSDAVSEAYDTVSLKLAVPIFAAPVAKKYGEVYLANKMNGQHNWPFQTAADYIDVAVDIGVLTVLGLYGAYRYSTARKKELAVQASKEKYKTLFEETNGGIYQSTPAGELLLANPAFAKMFGYDSVEDMKRSITTVKDMYAEPSDRNIFLANLDRKEHGHGLELHLKKKDGTDIWVSESARVVKDASGKVLFYEGIMQDITPRKNLEKQLTFLADRDALTGLYNRGYFSRTISQIVTECDQEKKNLGIIHLDLDDFKSANTLGGHARGDAILTTFAHHMSGELKETDYAIRFGGDEFVILLPGADARTGRKVITRLRNKLDLYNRHHNRDINYNLGFSAGFSLRQPGATEPIDYFIKLADDNELDDKKDKERRQQKR